MARKGKSGPTIPQMVARLSDADFLKDSAQVYEKGGLWHQKYPTQEEWNQHWPKFSQRIIEPFELKWGVSPPQYELLVYIQRRNPLFSVMNGQFGLIPIFPWTPMQEIKKRAATIRKAIGKVHRDSAGYPKGLIAQWVRSHPSKMGKAPRQEIARAVWGRTTGLQRPSQTEAMARLTEEKEVELYSRYKGDSASYREVERRVYRYARGSEAQAVATVRMAEKRAEIFRDAFYRSLVASDEFDTLGYATSRLLQGVFIHPPLKKALLRRHAAWIRDLIIKAGTDNFPPTT